VPTKHPRIDRTTTECQKLFASEAPDPGRHHVGTPGDIISECPGDFVGIRSDGFWLHRLLTAHGITNYVLEPTSILINRRARRAKTDRLDAIGMLRVLAAYLRGDRQSCSMVRVPTPEEEDAKRIHSERENLVHERLRIENRIEALLFTQGIRKRPSLRLWERDLANLRTGDGREMPRHLRAELSRLRRRLVTILDRVDPGGRGRA
jgi:transposase